MKAVLDVHYESDRAVAACVLFRHWRDGAPVQLLRAAAPNPLPYRSGRFYERELPCLTAVLERAGREFEAIVMLAAPDDLATLGWGDLLGKKLLLLL